MQIKIALAQMNPTLGNVAGNAAQIVAQAQRAVAAGAAVLITPELALCGYPPEDLALRPDFYDENARVLDQLAHQLPADLAVVVGHPLDEDDRYFNAASLLRGGRIEAVYRKQKLPNHSVFDEQRTFVAGDAACVFNCAGMRFGINICADIWETGTATQALAAGAEVLLVLNASQFHVNKQAERLEIARQRVMETGLPMVYVNTVGGRTSWFSMALPSRSTPTARSRHNFPPSPPGCFSSNWRTDNPWARCISNRKPMPRFIRPWSWGCVIMLARTAFPVYWSGPQAASIPR